MAGNVSVMTEKVPLPSRGIPYAKELEVPSHVLVRPFLTKDQKGLFGTGGSYGLDMLIDNCLNGDYKFKAKDLVAADKAMLLIRLRAISLGAKFTMEYTCPFCGGTTRYDWDLDSVDVNFFQCDTYPIPLVLPETGDKISWKLLTDGDLDEVEDFLTKMGDKFDSFNKRDERRQVREAAHICEVNGETVSLREAWEYYGNLPSTDSAYLSFIEGELDIGPDVRTTIKCSAPGCGRDFKAAMRTGLDFFRPKFELPSGLGVKKSNLGVDSDSATTPGGVRGDTDVGVGLDAPVRKAKDLHIAEGSEEE